MPKRGARNDDSDYELGSGGELSAEEDEEWHGDDGEEETADAAAEEDEAWEQRRQKKPISPVRTRATRKETKKSKPSATARSRAAAVPEGQWLKKKSAQSANVNSQIKLFDYLSGGGAKKSTNPLMDRFGYKGKGKGSSASRSRGVDRPLPEDEAFIDDGEEEDDIASFIVDDEEEIEIEFSDEEEEEERPKKRKKLKKGATRTTVLSSDEDSNRLGEYNEDLKRALKKSRMEHLRDREHRKKEDRELRKALRQSARHNTEKPSRITIDDDEDDQAMEEDDGEQEEEEEEEEDEDVSAVNNLLVKCEEKAQALHKLLQEMKEAQGKDEQAPSESIRVLKQPETLQRNLKSYQIAGLNWLHLLYRQKLNGILADEMGLGKTVQTISLLAQLKIDGNTGPHLIIVPASTLHNWKKELAAWCPDLDVLIFYGSLQERNELRSQLKTLPADHYNVWVTTYTVAQSKYDRAFLKKRKFKYLVLDEAQNIKNTSSQRYKSLFGLSAENKLLLTGTPVENTLNELVALLYFLMPRMFGSVRDYEELKGHLARAQKRSDLLESGFIGRMKQVIAPFLLRRLKSEVSIELDPKKERVVRCPMPELQAQLYDELLSRSKKTMADNAAAIEAQQEALDISEVMDDDDPRPKGTPKKSLPPRSPRKLSHGNLMNICMQLIKMADHPLLLRSHYTDDKVAQIARILKKHYPREFDGTLEEVTEDLQLNSDFVIHQVVVSHEKVPDSYHLDLDTLWEVSGKMDHLRTLLPELFAEDRRVLIFSLMTRMLDILEVFLEKIGYRFLRLDGATPVEERQELIDQFNTDLSIPIFLLSTKAGGLGINLTSADTVIFYDSSFNPQVDRQAEDRVHRLGQLKQVEIIRLLAENTIDEHIFKMAQQKKKLSEALLAEGSYVNEKSDMDVKDILKMISASVHAPSPMLSQGRATSKHTTASQKSSKPPAALRKITVSDEEAEDDDDVAISNKGGKAKANGETKKGSSHTNGSSSKHSSSTSSSSSSSKDKKVDSNGSAARKRKREEEEGKGRHASKKKKNTTIILDSEDDEKEEQEPTEEREESEDDSDGKTKVSSSGRKGSTTASSSSSSSAKGTTTKRARVREDKENAAPPSAVRADTAKPRQLTLEEFKRKYAMPKPK